MRQKHPLFLFVVFLLVTLAGGLLLQPAHASPTYAYEAIAEGQAIDADLVIDIIGLDVADVGIDIARSSSYIVDRVGIAPPCGDMPSTAGEGEGVEVEASLAALFGLEVSAVDVASCASDSGPPTDSDSESVVSVDASVTIPAVADITAVEANTVYAETTSRVDTEYSTNSEASVQDATISQIDILTIIGAEPAFLDTGVLESSSQTQTPLPGDGTALVANSTSTVNDTQANLAASLPAGLFTETFLTADVISCTATATVDENGMPSADFALNFANANLDQRIGPADVNVDLSAQPEGTVLAVYVQVLGNQTTIAEVTVGADIVEETVNNPSPGPSGIIQSATVSGVALRIELQLDVPALGLGAGTIVDIGRCDAHAEILNEAPATTEIALFDGQVNDGVVEVMWVTLDEQTLEGFNLYRSDENSVPASPINESLIEAQYSGLPMGASYLWDDPDLPQGTYYYWLDVVELDGSHALHGPITVEVEGVTAVTIDTMTTATSSPLPLALAGTLALTAGLAAKLVRRRRAR